MGSNIYSYRQLHANLTDKLATPEFLDDIRNLARDLRGYSTSPPPSYSCNASEHACAMLQPDE